MVLVFGECLFENPKQLLSFTGKKHKDLRVFQKV